MMSLLCCFLRGNGTITAFGWKRAEKAEVERQGCCDAGGRGVPRRCLCGAQGKDDKGKGKGKGKDAAQVRL